MIIEQVAEDVKVDREEIGVIKLCATPLCVFLGSVAGCSGFPLITAANALGVTLLLKLTREFH
jgi:hypothetical protein